MIYLLLSIICTAGLILMFKFFEQKNIPVFQAIVFNYLSATLCAVLFLPDKTPLLTGQILQNDWVPLSLLLGTMFIVVFNLTGITAIRYGVSTASVAMKLGLIFPVFMAFAFYGERFNWVKFTGIIFAIASVIFSSVKADSSEKKLSVAALPVIVFIGSGTCDALTQFANKRYVNSEGMEEFSLFLFLAAALSGSSVLVFQLLTKRAVFHIRNLAGGVVLGIINYFSFLFLLKALSVLSQDSSEVFPVMNLGTVIVTTVAGIILFKEKISSVNWLGLGLAVVSIMLILLSGFL